MDTKASGFDLESVLTIARVRLDDHEKSEIKKQLDELFAYFAEIQEIKVDGSEISEDSATQLRNDSSHPIGNHDLIVEGFTHKKDRHMDVPKTIE